jgi:hypothetical protein
MLQYLLRHKSASNILVGEKRDPHSLPPIVFVIYAKTKRTATTWAEPPPLDMA